MKNTLKFTLTILAIALMVACDSEKQQSDINLNDGEKWKVNSEMKPHIERGNEMLDDFISENGTDYLQLAENLKAQNSALVKSCTMKGESHDELHKWLHPHLELTDQLSDAKSLDKAKEIIPQLEASFDTYENYFE